MRCRRPSCLRPCADFPPGGIKRAYLQKAAQLSKDAGNGMAARAEQERERLDAMVLRADRSEDFREAAQAFAQKRPPVFRGR